MANQEQLALLEQGAEAWNQWRTDNPTVNVDLSGADLSGADLSGADLRDVNLGSADLNHANLSEANLSGADLTGANLSHIDLRDADLRDANLSDTRLNEATISGANLTGASLNSADLSGAALNFANFRDADLSGANLSGTNLSDGIQIDPKWKLVHKLVNEGGEDRFLPNADLSDANLSGANFRDASLIFANLNHTNLRGADLSNANLDHASLSDANLRGADLSDANLDHVNLCNADLSNADLSNADLSTADLSNANLSGANLAATRSLATSFTDATFTGACLEDWNINSETKLDGAICEYVYLKQNEKERRPSSGTFKPGEFTLLFQKALETVDLIFADGIDWKAFFASFQELQAEYEDDNLSIQALEKKSGGAFIIRLEVLAGADKVAIESGLKERYEMRLQFQEERYRVELQAKDREIEIYKQKSADMMEIVILQASRTISVEAKAVVDQSKSETFQNDYRGANIANNANKITGNAQQTASQFSQNSSQNLDDIIKLINSLRETAQAFPEAQREETLGHLGDLEHDLKQPSNDRTPRRIKATLAALLAIAGIVAATTDFSNNVLEIFNKLGIELLQPQKQQLPPSSK